MKATVLLTGGRAPATLDLARFFSRAGIRVVTADSLRFPLTRFSRAVAHHARVPAPRPDPGAFLAALRTLVHTHRVDLLIPTCEECFSLADVAGLPAFVEERERLLQVHSKQRFADLARSLGLPVPPTRRVTSPEEALEAWGAGPVVLKPEFSRFAARVLIRPGREQVLRADIRPDRPWVIQSYRPGRIVCTYSLVHRGRIAAHAAYAAEITWGPGSAVVFRSVDDRATPGLGRALRALGYRLVDARRVYHADPSDPALFGLRDVKHDLRLARRTSYRAVEVRKADLPRVRDLYERLYLDKYSRYNPRFTLDFLRLALDEGLIEMRALAVADRIDAVWGTFRRGRRMTQPLFGYDTSLPQGLGLYRLLSLQVLEVGRERRLEVRQSSGAGRFKRLRGGVPTPEYLAVYDAHLPVGRRLPWGLVQTLAARVGRPLVERFGL
ncbi:MAG: GNAT family N-acetyltransferase [Armatimonadetes bacterium]|nr:GNAT family N-acetyltransferase [Armatimonadota bacterium]